MINYCFYINLERRKDRKEFIEKELNKSRLLRKKYKRFPATDGSLLHPRYIQEGLLSQNAIEDVLMDSVTAWGLSMSQGGLGVLLSYLKLFEKVIELDSVVLAFEDDTELEDNFDENLTKVFTELPEDFDICYLGYGGEIKTRFFSDRLAVPEGMVTCLPAILISPKGAKRLLEILKNIDNQIDTAIYTRFGLLNAFVCVPRLVRIRNQFSTDIQGNNNLKKKYEKQNYIFATLAHGEEANKNALKLAFELYYFQQKILILTDQPSLYKNIDTVIVREYPSKRFSYNDKIICFEEALKLQEAVVFIDSDVRIYYKNFKNCFTNFFHILKGGFHPSFSWGKLLREGGSFFTKDLHNRTEGYGALALKLAKELKIPIEKASHYQEGILILAKEKGKEKIFFNTWRKLAEKLDAFEIQENSPTIGRGEGNLIGLALAKSKITIHTSKIANTFGENLLYNFNSRKNEYQELLPNRQLVAIFDGKLIANNCIFVSFKDKNIPLKYTIFELENGRMSLYFTWNADYSVELLNHEFMINGKVYHFDSAKQGEFFFDKQENVVIYHSYEWYGERNWNIIERIGGEDIVFALVCFGENKRNETLNLLNDLRNLGHLVYVWTNIDLQLDYFQFDTVIEKRIEKQDWNCFERKQLVKTIFEETSCEYVYSLDADSRFFDGRIEKYNKINFKLLLDALDFDILTSRFSGSIIKQLQKPKPDEDKNARNFRFGYDVLIDYFKKINPNYDSDIQKEAFLEGVLIFKRSDRMQKYLNELLQIRDILWAEDEKNNRIHKACASGFAMSLISSVFGVKVIENPIVHHFFKPNFLQEVFPSNQKFDISTKVFKNLKKPLSEQIKNIEIHMLICKRDVILAIHNLNSLQKYAEFSKMPVFLHDDGSLDNFDKELLIAEVPNVILIERKLADLEIEKYLKNHKLCHKFRLEQNPIHLWHKIKLFDYFFFSKSKRILGLDSDLLFLNKPENILALIQTDTPFYFPDIQSAYCYNEPKKEIPVLEKVNTGIIFMPSEEHYNLDAIEFSLTNLIRNNKNYFPSWIEQSAFAHMFYADGHYKTLDPERYKIPFFQSVDPQKIECLHFVSFPAVRETYKNYTQHIGIPESDKIIENQYTVSFRDLKIPLNIQINKNKKYLTVEFHWDIGSVGLQSLSHHFKVKTQNGETIYKFHSESKNSFILPIYDTNFELYHSYEWYGETDWKLVEIFSESLLIKEKIMN